MLYNKIHTKIDKLMSTEQRGGLGSYTIQEAIAFTRISYAKIRHWICGDLRTKKNRTLSLIKTDIGKIEGQYYLSFNDLMELMMVDSFMESGVTIHTIRKAYKYASEYYKTFQPFTKYRFYTDSKGIYSDLEKNIKNVVTEDTPVYNMLTGQAQLARITRMFLDSVDFVKSEHSSNIPLRWWPMSDNRHVVIDPQRNYGHPIINRSGVATIILAQGVATEKSVKRVAYWYNVDEGDVRAAVKFETHTGRVAA